MATRNKDREMRIAIKRVEGFAKELCNKESRQGYL